MVGPTPSDLAPRRARRSVRGAALAVAIAVAVVVASAAGAIPGFRIGLVRPPPASPPTSFGVTFVASGVPDGLSWGIDLAGTDLAATGTTLEVTEPNGAYAYSVVAPAEYEATPASGTLTVAGGPVAQGIAFVVDPESVPYAVTFDASGLPAGTGWNVTLAGVTIPTVTAAVQFVETDGVYPFDVGPVANYTATPRDGSVTVDNGTVTIEVAFALNLSSGPTTVTETGSSVLYPLLADEWGPAFAQFDPSVALSAASTGSGTGQSDAEAGLVDIGASDGYVVSAAPYGIENIPVAISGELVIVNLPGLSGIHLNLNGTVLGQIYAGAITQWNAPLIAAANPGVSLPSASIVPVVRSDSTYDTYLFSEYCDMSDPGWTFGSSTVAFSATSWEKVAGGAEMVATVASTPYSLGYAGLPLLPQVADDGLGLAALGDSLADSAGGGNVTAHPADGAHYVLPTAANISEDAVLATGDLNISGYGLALSLVLGGSNGSGPVSWTTGGGGTDPTAGDPDPYPIANLEYLLVKTAPSGSVTSSDLNATLAFLEWAVTAGNYARSGGPSLYLSVVALLPLVTILAGYAVQAIAGING